VSEPEAGSDVAALRTNARKDGGDFVINGEKMWITNSLQADFMVALVNTSDDANIHRNKSLIVIPMDLPGITKNKIEKMGMHASDTGHIFFDDVRVPARNVIGEVGRGFTYQMEQFQEERLWACIIGITQMQNVVDETIEYTRQRKIFGQSVLDNQVVHYKLAELETEIEFFRIAVAEALDRYMAGEDTLKLLSMVKLKLGRLNRLVTDGCVQFWGGMGFANGSLASQYYRDTRLGSIGGGADEVMLRIIAKTMGILAERRAR
jgi:citronellyl-CoA dehydrogenase